MAEQITADEGPSVTSEVEELLARFSVDGCFDPTLWPQLVGYAQIRPYGDILTVRAKYDPHSPSWGIGVNPLSRRSWPPGPGTTGHWPRPMRPCCKR